ncbi:hypothetical protein EBI01_20430, partial [Marinomonas rhizomae]|uniref:hypothetical protein n=1 Tax=Marinomonas rhizomae TaxID=491948 RepID=UPI000F3D9C3F
STKSPHEAMGKQGIGVSWWRVRWFELGVIGKSVLCTGGIKESLLVSSDKCSCYGNIQLCINI